MLLASACVVGTIQAADLPAALLDLPQWWRDDRGGAEKLSEWRGRYAIVSMFYIGCHRTCPQTVSVMRALQLEFRSHGIEPEAVLVSYAAEADNARSLAQFRQTQHLDAHWHLLAGDQEGTRQLAGLLGLADYNAMDGHIFHDFRILLLDPQGKVETLDWRHRDASSAVAALFARP